MAWKLFDQMKCKANNDLCYQYDHCDRISLLALLWKHSFPCEVEDQTKENWVDDVEYDDGDEFTSSELLISRYLLLPETLLEMTGEIDTVRESY